jgi:hypothetical protein
MSRSRGASETQLITCTSSFGTVQAVWTSGAAVTSAATMTGCSGCPSRVRSGPPDRVGQRSAWSDGSLAAFAAYGGWTRQAGGDEVSGFCVCTGEPGGVDLERGCSAASVAEPACHGAQVDAASE